VFKRIMAVGWLALAIAGGGRAAFALPVITIPRVDKAPTINGDIDPKEWAAAQHLSPFVLLGGRGTPSLQSDVMLEYDSKALYIAAYLLDPQPDKLKAEVLDRDGPVYSDDSFEMFFDTEGKRQNYAHLVVNPKNTQFDEANHDKSVNYEWQSKTSITSDGWRVEVALPFAGGVAPQPGEAWNLSVCRNAVRVREASCWSLDRQSFHEPESFGVLVFGTAPVRCLIDDLGKRWLGQNTLRFQVANPAKAAATFKANVKVVGGDKRGESYNARTLTLAGHAKLDASVAYKVAQDGLGSVTFSLTDPAGKAFYRTAAYPIDIPSASVNIEATERALSAAMSGWAGLPKSALKDELQGELEALSASWKSAADRYRGRERMTGAELSALKADAAKLEAEATRMQRKIDTARGVGGAPGEFGVGAAAITRHVMPDDLDVTIGKPVHIDACRNEWRSAQIAILPFDKEVKGVTVSCGDLVADKAGARVPAAEVQTRLADLAPAVRPGDPGDAVRQWPDILRDNAGPFDLQPRQTRCVWLTVHVPENTAPDTYRGSVVFKTAGAERSELLVEVSVHSPVAPKPQEYRLGVDFWQDTDRLASEYKVERWSADWWKLVEAYLTDMAAHGEDVIQVDRSYFDWRRAENGVFSFGYDRFDRYVDLCLKLGIRHHIEYLQMFDGRGPSQVTYTLADGSEQKITTNPGDDAYNVAWLAFLKDFAAHLKAKGWWDMLWVCPTDEPQDVYGVPTLTRFEQACGLLKLADPGYKVTVALDSLESAQRLAPVVDRFVFKLREDVYNRPFAQSLLAQGKRVETYICCHPDRPNSFITSDAIDQVIIGWLCYREDFAGLLRWSYMNWPADVWHKPEGDGALPPGDLFVVYPGEKGPISSTRWERLREGFEDYELLRRLRDSVAAAWKTGHNKEAIAAEQALNDAVATVCGPHLGGLTQYTTDPEVYAQARAKVLKALETLPANSP
jgi:hypothetical protein